MKTFHIVVKKKKAEDAWTFMFSIAYKLRNEKNEQRPPSIIIIKVPNHMLRPEKLFQLIQLEVYVQLKAGQKQH